MEWLEDDVRWAFKIFMKLLEKGVIDETQRDYHYNYSRPEVRNILEEVIEKEADVKIFSTGDMLFLSPGVGNRVFGYKNDELRKKLGLRNNSELYLAYFIILNLLAKFYNSDDQSLASRQFVPLEELEETVSMHVNTIMEADPEEIEAQEDNYRINLLSVAETWLDIPAFDDKIVNLKKAVNNRISFILRIMRFLEEEGLVQVLEDREIRLLPKMEHLVVKYYFNSHRKDYLLQMLSESLPLLAKDISAAALELKE